MKHIAIILAGGVGSRMGAPQPKQFLEIKKKPVIVHTIQNFQDNENIDAVLIVCIKDWIPYLQSLVKQYGLTKVQWVIEGGNTCHDSTRNGVFFLKNILDNDDFCIIHDAARLILPQLAINQMLEIAHKKGNASLAIPCYETMLFTDDQLSGIEELDRGRVMRIQTPQTYKFSQILSLYEKAEKDGLHDFVYADIVASHYGERVYFSKGFTNNIKLTRKEDISLCEALMEMPEDKLFTI